MLSPVPSIDFVHHKFSVNVKGMNEDVIYFII